MQVSKLGVEEWLVSAVMSMYTGARTVVRTVYGCAWVNVFFWYQLTRVVPDKGELNGCVCACK